MTKEELEYQRKMTQPEVQRQLRRQAYSYEARHENTAREIIRKVRTRSLDVPGSPESRIEIADHKQAAIIRACKSKVFYDNFMPLLNDKPASDYDFYSTRMKWAIEYIRKKRGYPLDSKEYKEMMAFLWMVWKNWRDGKAKETIAALGIDPAAYKTRIWRLTKDFEHPEWAAYCIYCAINYGVRQRIEEEKRERGGILLVRFTI